MQRILSTLAAALFWLPGLVLAETGLEIADPWSPQAPPGRMMAGFMGLHNTTETPIRLVDAASPLFGRVEIHTMVMDEGVMRMRRLDELLIEPGQQVALQPGGLHLMLMQPLSSPELGDQIEIVLIDDQGRRYPLLAEVRVRHRPAMVD